MHRAVGTSPNPGEVGDAHAFQGEAGLGSPGSGVRSPRSLRLGERLSVLLRKTCFDLFEICLDLSETGFDLPKACLDFFVVFAEQRRWTADLPPRLMQLIRRPQVGQCSCRGMNHFDE